MPRFSWAAWGLLVVVLDLPLLGWDVLPDLVGYVWLFIGLAGGAACTRRSLGPGSRRWSGSRCRSITGTPSPTTRPACEWAAVFAGILVNVVVLHQLAHRHPRPRPGRG